MAGAGARSIEEALEVAELASSSSSPFGTASSGGTPTTPSGLVLAAARKVAGELEGMDSLLKGGLTAGQRKDLILAARRMTEVAGELVTAANALSAASKEVKDQEHIISAAVRARKAALNLKILAAMAAASEPGNESDNSSKLDQSFTELSGAVVELVEQTQFAALPWHSA